MQRKGDGLEMADCEPWGRLILAGCAEQRAGEGGLANNDGHRLGLAVDGWRPAARDRRVECETSRFACAERGLARLVNECRRRGGSAATNKRPLGKERATVSGHRLRLRLRLVNQAEADRTASMGWSAALPAKELPSN